MIKLFQVGYFLLIFHYAWSQIPLNQPIDLPKNGATSLVDALQLIEHGSGYTFAYGNALSSPCTVDLPQSAVPFHELLDILCTPCRLEWTIVGEHIILTKRATFHYNYTLQGRVSDKLTGQPIEYATVYIPNTPHGTQTDSLGYYRLTNIHIQKIKAQSTLLGYRPVNKDIQLGSDSMIVLNWQLSPIEIPLNTAIFHYDRITDQTSISQISLSKSDIRANLNISDDPLKAIIQLPSVASKGDLLSSNELYIRGGEPNENLILMDNVRFLWPYYLGGTSVSNPDAIEKVEVLSGAYQTNYGNALSGIINLTTRNGSRTKYKGAVGLSPFHASWTVEGPFKKNKSSFLLAYRNTNRLLFANRSVNLPQSNDFTVKLFFQLSKNHRLSYTNLTVTDKLDLSKIYFGLDSLRIPLSTNNLIGGQSLQWQAVFFGSVYNKLSLHLSDQKIITSLDQPRFPSTINLNNSRLSLRNDMAIYMNEQAQLKLGYEISLVNLFGNTQSIYHATDIQIPDSTLLYFQRDVEVAKGEMAGYFNYSYLFGSQWKHTWGLRANLSKSKHLLTFSPRWNTTFAFNDQLNFNASVGLFRQDPDLSNGSQLGLLKQNKVIQSNIGAQYQWNASTYFWMEAYHKYYYDLIVLNPDFIYDNSGNSRVRGVEFFVQHQRQNLLFRGSYSLSKATRKRHLQTQSYPFYYDQRHRLNIYLNYNKVARSYRILPTHYVLNYRVFSGTPYTNVSGYEPDSLIPYPIFEEINQARNPIYHNMNLKLTWEYFIGKRKKTKLHIFLEYWNLLNTKNILGRRYAPNPNLPGEVITQLQYYEPRIPNIGIKLWFNN